MTESAEKEKKDIPSVGKPKRNNVAGLIVFLAVLGILLYGLFSPEKTKPKQKVEESFNAPTYKSNFVGRRDPKKDEPKSASGKNRQLSREEMLAILEQRRASAEAQQKAADKKKAEELENAKRRSNITIFKGKGLRAEKSEAVKVAETPRGEGFMNLSEPRQVKMTKAGLIANISNTVAAGKFIQGVLETAIDSTLPGQVRAIVSNDLYSEDGRNILIPKGSRLVGQYQSGIREGQNRVFVIWSHATTPQGVQIGLESSGTDSLGTAGLSGDYDSHFFQRFGAAILLSVVESYEENAGTNRYNINTGDSLNKASTVALNKSINIPPTIYVDQGEKINVFIARNLSFEGVNNVR